MVQPAVLRGGLEHRVFAAHLVGECRHPEFVLDPAHDVEIRHARLDHHHVGALGDVHRHFAQGLVAVARIHLVDLLVALAKAGRRADRVAEGAVERAGVLGAVGHDARVDGAVRFERRADRADSPVHHVGGRDDIDAGLGLGQRLPHQHRHRFVVEDVTAVVEQAVLPVAGERVEGDVGHQAKLWEFLFQLAYHPRHQALRIPGFLSVRRLERWIDHRKQRHHRDAQLDALRGDRQQQVQAESLHAGHRSHRIAPLPAFLHEHGIDQVMRSDHAFAHQVAGEVVPAQPPRTALGVGGMQAHGENCAPTIAPLPVSFAVNCVAGRRFDAGLPGVQTIAPLKLSLRFVKLAVGGLPLPAFPP